jgi:hypothetical protein
MGMIERPPLPRGFVDICVWRAGVLIERTLGPNLIVGGSRFIHAQLLGAGGSGNTITQVGFGSSVLPAADGNASLSVDAYIKPVDAVSYPAANKVAFGISLGLVEANDLVLAEYGLLTATGRLYARLVRTAPLVKDGSVSLSATWTITF